MRVMREWRGHLSSDLMLNINYRFEHEDLSKHLVLPELNQIQFKSIQIRDTAWQQKIIVEEAFKMHPNIGK